MAKRIYIEGNYLIIVEDLDTVNDIWNTLSNVYVEKNGELFIFYKVSTNEIIESIFYAEILDRDGNAYADIATFTSLMQVKTGKPDSIDVVVQDGTSPLMIVKASKVVIETTTTTLGAIDDYIINVTSATSFVVGQYMTIYNADDNRVFFADILSINVLAITINAPLDFAFPIGSFVSVGDTNLNVNGSVTPQIFGIRNPTGIDIPLSFDVVRLMFKCLTSSSIDLSEFGDIPGGLTRGLVVRKTDGTYYNVFNAKTNGEMKNIMYDFDIQAASGNQQDGFTARLTFGGWSKMGAVIRLREDEDLQIIVQDDLTSLGTFSIIAEGSQVVD